MSTTTSPATLGPLVEAIDTGLLLTGACVLLGWSAALARSGHWRRPLPLRIDALGPSPLVLAGIFALYLGLTSLAGSLAAAPLDARTALQQPGSPAWFRVSLAVNVAKLLACLPIPMILGMWPEPAPADGPRLRGAAGMREVRRAVGAVVGGALAVHALTTAQAFLMRWVWTSWLGLETPPVHNVLSGLTSGQWGWAGAAQLYVTAIVVAPLSEELFFRGLLCAVLRPLLGVWGAIAVSAVLFGLVHLPQWTDVLPLMSMGVVLGYLRYRRSLAVCVGVHALFNARTMIFATLAPELLPG